MVHPGSPAATAGLTAGADYLLGTTNAVFREPSDLSHAVMGHLNKPLNLYVYSALTDAVRVATVVPSDLWGGGGLLGCETGSGYLHRLPQDCCETAGRVHVVRKENGERRAERDERVYYHRPLRQCVNTRSYFVCSSRGKKRERQFSLSCVCCGYPSRILHT